MWHYTLSSKEAYSFLTDCPFTEEAFRDYGKEIILVAMDRYSDEDVRTETAKRVGLCELSGWEPERQIVAEPLGERLSEDGFEVEEIWSVYIER